VLDNGVAKTGYLAGDGFTFADMNLLPILAHVRLSPEAAAAIARAMHLAAYYERHSAPLSFTNTIPPPPPERWLRPALTSDAGQGVHALSLPRPCPGAASRATIPCHAF